MAQVREREGDGSLPAEGVWWVRLVCSGPQWIYYQSAPESQSSMCDSHQWNGRQTYGTDNTKLDCTIVAEDWGLVEKVGIAVEPAPSVGPH
jgi:hypothetical protein